MDNIVEDIAKTFQSARLRYIHGDDLDAHFKAFIPQIVQDPIIHAMAAPTVLKPKGKADCDVYAESISKSLLGVAVCLSPDEEQRLLEEAANPETTGKLAEKKANANGSGKKPTIIGIACLGWGGISPSVAHHRNAHIGINLAKPYQNKGYGREVIDWMLDWAFKHAGLHSVTICAASYNPRAIHLYQDIGFVLEGRRRETIWFNRGWHDELEFGMTEKEWEILRGISPSINPM